MNKIIDDELTYSLVRPFLIAFNMPISSISLSDRYLTCTPILWARSVNSFNSDFELLFNTTVCISIFFNNNQKYLKIEYGK